MGRWIEVARPREIPMGTGRTVLADGRRLALFNDGGDFFAIDDTCPHRGASLGEGLLVQGKVICPWHSWIFELRTGSSPKAPEVGVGAYPTRCDGEVVEVELPGD